MKKLNFTLALALAFAMFGNAQVQFKLSYEKETERYTVSLIPAATYVNPQNITGTGQVTLRVPSNQFDPVDIVNLLEGMHWEANSRNNSPSEAPDYDYISFGLIIQGVAYPNYQAGLELPLFSFQNAYGCTGSICLVDNWNDPFMPPNSQNANIGNTITILGAGGDAYTGNVDGGLCDCDGTGSTTAVEEDFKLDSFKVFPNPASDFVNVEINWSGETRDANLQVLDPLGRKLVTQPVSLTDGTTTFKVNVADFAPGAYWVNLAGEDWKLSLDRITKQ